MTELTIEEKQAIILEIMTELDSFCRKEGIRYSLAFGTLLGAVRHGGFIPWDDDSDIYMLRSDFDRFVRTFKSDRFHLLYNTRRLPDEFHCMGFAKLSDPSTFVTHDRAMTRYGVFVDIFPVDDVPAEPKARKKFMDRVVHRHNRLYHRQHRDWLSRLKAHTRSLDWWWRHTHDALHDPACEGSPYAAALLGPKDRMVFPKEIFDSLRDIDFAGHKFLAFADTHGYLTEMFGEDYMTPKKWAHNDHIYRKEE